jgi:hypothetical protein
MGTSVVVVVHAGVIVDGDVQGLPSGMLVLATAAAVAAPRDLLEAGQALDIEMEQVAGSGMFVAHDGRGGICNAAPKRCAAPPWP